MIPTRKPKKPSRPKSGAPEASRETPPFVRVWEIIQSVPRGKVVTYGQLSNMIDRRLTPVGVGWAIRAAPAESGLPWQRVVNGQGGISTDGEHPGLQRTLLEKEGVRFGHDGTIDLRRYGWLAGVLAADSTPPDDATPGPQASRRRKTTSSREATPLPRKATQDPKATAKRSKATAKRPAAQTGRDAAKPATTTKTTVPRATKGTARARTHVKRSRRA
ncbi:MGMT family protein [Pendulispora albinea]|uniref:MGMT family protein n=1 Tax=Pendulispora albinea TaxID=2741071 RepID=A0ABZ2LME3_9BACT